MQVRVLLQQVQVRALLLQVPVQAREQELLLREPVQVQAQREQEQLRVQARPVQVLPAARDGIHQIRIRRRISDSHSVLFHNLDNAFSTSLILMCFQYLPR